MSRLLVGATLALLLAGCDSGTGQNAENLSYEDLGPFKTDADGLVDVPWDMPEGVVSSEVFCGPYGYDTLATADDVTDASGSAVYDDDAPSSGGLRVSVLDDTLPVLVPVSPNLEAAAGTWTLGLYISASDLPTTVSCAAINRIGDTAATNTVDVNLVFVGVDGLSAGLNAQSGAGHEGLQSALTTLDDLWSDLGLAVGNVRYTDFDGATDTYTTIEGAEEFGDLLRTASDGPELTFFFVQDIDLGDGASILGLSGGPPGVAGYGGTSKSGVVINAADLDASPDEIALIMAHEGGHFLGLFHPTEKDLTGVDPLDDTPECSDSDGDGALTSAECAGSGAENVMWPTAQVGTATTFSADQGWVVARNPITIPD